MVPEVSCVARMCSVAQSCLFSFNESIMIKTGIYGVLGPMKQRLSSMQSGSSINKVLCASGPSAKRPFYTGQTRTHPLGPVIYLHLHPTLYLESRVHQVFEMIWKHYILEEVKRIDPERRRAKKGHWETSQNRIVTWKLIRGYPVGPNQWQGREWQI